MCQTAYHDYIFHTIVTRITVTFQQSPEAFQEVLRVLPLPTRLVFIQDDRGKSVVSSQIDPQIGLRDCRFPFFVQNLTDRFVCVEDLTFQKFLMKKVIDWLEIFKRAFDAPVRYCFPRKSPPFCSQSISWQ